jgi:hypothetical protein
MDKLMNKRIRELAEQAGIYVFDDLDENHYWVFEKFAELIVRECRDMFVVNSPSWNLLNEKLEHFGVEDVN